MPLAPLYGQVVAGPPGSGKTTYCTGMQEYLRLLGRNVWVINLDPANEVPKTKPSSDDESSGGLPYDTLLDVCDSVVNLSSVMKQLGLGPNGGLVYCMEYLEAHVDDVVALIRDQVESQEEQPYLIFDLPGQVELYTHGTAVPRLLHQLVKVLELRLVAIQLIDAHYCTEPANFLSAALLGTTTMVKLELPTVSVLSKVDLLINYGPLPFSLDFFAECQDLERLLPFLQGGSGGADIPEDDIYGSGGSPPLQASCFDYADDPDYQKARRRTRASPFFRKHEKLHRALAEVVEDFGLLSFVPLDISSAESVGHLVAKIDKCNGYVFRRHGTVSSEKVDGQGQEAQDLFQCAVQSTEQSHFETIADIQERLSDAKAHMQQQQQEQGSETATSLR